MKHSSTTIYFKKSGQLRILFKVTELLSIQGGPFITVKSKIIMINDHLSGFIDLKINNIMAGTSFIIIS